jgi:DNA-binding PadR family transcriptional regulator
MMENDDMFPRWFDPRAQFDDDDEMAAGRRGRPPRRPPMPPMPGEPPMPPMPPRGPGEPGGPWRGPHHGQVPGGGPPWSGSGWGGHNNWPGFGNMFGRARARRGNVRSAILTLLAGQAMNGYQIMQAIEQRSNGTWKPSSGSIYPTLQQLEDEGLVETEEAKPGQQGSKAFKLSAKGKRYVDDNRAELEADWMPAEEPAADPRWALMNEYRQVAGAAAQVASAGTPKQLEEARQLLGELRRNLYRILADLPAEDDE